jgi:hypothetical protein
VNRPYLRRRARNVAAPAVVAALLLPPSAITEPEVVGRWSSGAYSQTVSVDRWDDLGDARQTERWRSVLPELSVAAGEDLTGVNNGLERVAAIRQRYVLGFKHLIGPRGSWHGGVSTGVTRLRDWSPLTERERVEGRPCTPLVLCRGVPSGLVDGVRSAADGGLDFAIRVTVPPTFLPAGLLLLDGVPIVVHRHRPFRPLPIDADILRPPEVVSVPDYLTA